MVEEVQQMTKQLEVLSRKVPSRYITDNGRGMEAMDHTVVTQLLLWYLGPYSFEVVEVIYDAPKKNPADRLVTGVLGKLTVEIDGREITITEAGGVENVGNIDGGGERAKHAASDALKRCAMRLGLGLHIWAKDKDGRSVYFLDEKLKPKQEADNG